MEILVGFFYVLPVISVLCLVVGLFLTGRPALAALALAIPMPLVYALAMSVIALDEPDFLPVGLLPVWFTASVLVLTWAAVSVWRQARLQRVATLLGLAMPLPALVATLLLFVPLSVSS